MLEETNQVVSQVENRTSTTDWTHVPLIGASSSHSFNLKESVQSEVMYHLEKLAQKEKGAQVNNVVSAWDVTKEYRDALEIGPSSSVHDVRMAI